MRHCSWSNGVIIATTGHALHVYLPVANWLQTGVPNESRSFVRSLPGACSGVYVGVWVGRVTADRRRWSERAEQEAADVLVAAYALCFGISSVLDSSGAITIRYLGYSPTRLPFRSVHRSERPSDLRFWFQLFVRYTISFVLLCFASLRSHLTRDSINFFIRSSWIVFHPPCSLAFERTRVKWNVSRV